MTKKGQQNKKSVFYIKLINQNNKRGLKLLNLGLKLKRK